MVKLWPIPVFSDNYIWILQTDSSSTATVVDPGDGLAVLAAFDRRGLEPNAVLLTHHHADHVGGVDELCERYQIPVFGPARESIKEVDRPVSDADTVAIPELGLELEVIEVPGHTAGHVAYAGPGFVLCGDTLFAGGCGRVFEGTPEQMFDSLSRLVALGPDTTIYCAHEYTVANLRFAAEVEPQNDELHQRLAAALELREQDQPTVPSILADELRTNPFLRCGEPSVREAAERFAGTTLGSEVEVFATVRAWKDGWQG